MQTEEKTVAAVERALSILEVFGQEDDALSLAVISERSGINKSTILRLAATLERFGYLGRTATGEFRFGPKPLLLGAHYQRWLQPADVILPALNELAERTGESSSFMVRHGDARLCVYRVHSEHSVRDHMLPGDLFPIGRGAAGKIIVAFTKPFKTAYATIRTEMIAETNSELTPDVAAIAAPIFNARGEIHGAISISGPNYRFTKKAIDRAKVYLLEQARSVSVSIGADGELFQRGVPDKKSSS